MLVIRLLTLVTRETCRIVISLGQLQAHIVLIVRFSILRVVVDELTYTDFVNFFNETCLDIVLAICFFLLVLSRLLQIVLLVLHVAHLMVVFIRHGQPWVTK